MRGERVKVDESRTLTRKRGVRAIVWSGKSGLHGEEKQIVRRKGRARRASLEQVKGSMWGGGGRKSSPGRSAESWFHFKFGQI